MTDTKLHVDDTGGEGRPVVLIQGWPLSGEPWKDTVPAIEAAGYRAVVIHGDADVSHTDQFNEALVAFLGE